MSAGPLAMKLGRLQKPHCRAKDFLLDMKLYHKLVWSGYLSGDVESPSPISLNLLQPLRPSRTGPYGLVRKICKRLAVLIF